jgi:ribose transport system substrate-binding protein
MRSSTGVAVVVCLALLPACRQQADSVGSGSSDKAAPQIAVIPKATTFTFWKAVHAGAAAAADEAGAEIFWMGPSSEGDRRAQIEVVQNFVSRQVDAIVLAPLDASALARPVEEAVGRDIPVVVIDSALDSDAQSSFVATDNTEGGRMAARRLAEVMGRKGNVILLRYQEGSASNDEREDGFLAELEQQYPDINVLSSNQYAGTTKDSAMKKSQDLLNKFGDRVDGIFCPNEPVAFGMLRALETSKLAGKVKFVAFDAGDSLIQAMQEGSIHGLVAQDPYGMGYEGVKTALAVLAGETVEKRIPTRVVSITLENLDTPEIQSLIKPEVQASQE